MSASTLDCAAFRFAHARYLLLTGRMDVEEEILDVMFREFCVGK